MITTALGGYDTHFLALIDSENANKPLDTNIMRGLVVFHQDANTGTDPEGNKFSKVSIYHISCVQPSELEPIVKLAMDFIWKTMHCATIRIHLDQVHVADGKMQTYPEYKRIFKERGFRWKNLTNHMATGRRIQILELNNKDHREQLKASTAFIYRRGLSVGDFQKQPFSLRL